LTDLVYPVYRLGLELPQYSNGVVMYYRHYLLEDGTEESRYYVVDDTNVPGATLARRRLYLYQQGVRLKPVSRAVFFLGDLIKVATASTWFIDSAGNVFRYKKQARAKLTFKKIKQRHLIPTGGAILEVEGIATRFKCLYAPRDHEIYAGILQMGMQYILYGVSETKHKDTWRMV